ncbi:MAG: hypothetical protein WCB15_34445 [Desulfobacterales bacterium]
MPDGFIKHTTSDEGQKTTRIVLSPKERDWLEAHPDITFGYTDTFEPAVIVNKDGSYRGSLVDFLELLNQRLGTDFKLTVGPIPDILNQASRKELTGILSVAGPGSRHGSTHHSNP